MPVEGGCKRVLELGCGFRGVAPLAAHARKRMKGDGEHCVVCGWTGGCAAHVSQKRLQWLR